MDDIEQVNKDNAIYFYWSKSEDLNGNFPMGITQPMRERNTHTHTHTHIYIYNRKR